MTTTGMLDQTLTPEGRARPRGRWASCVCCSRCGRCELCGSRSERFAITVNHCNRCGRGGGGFRAAGAMHVLAAEAAG